MRISLNIDRHRRAWRQARMRSFLAAMQPTPTCRILDIGGTPELWKLIDVPLRVTILNLEEVTARFSVQDRQRHEVMTGSIFDNLGAIADVDLVFSNSVLEHLEPGKRLRALCDRIGEAASYWIQVPAPGFPVEAHCRELFWWKRSAAARMRTIKAWERAGDPFIAHQMATTHPISRDALKSLLPGSEIAVERLAGWPKSYVAFRRAARPLSN